MMAVLCGGSSAFAQESVPDAFRSTGYPVPRFVSLRSNEVFARTGPGTKYPVQWVYRKSGLPVEITLEFENWRKIRDIKGDEGWVHHSLLSGRRTAIIQKPEEGGGESAAVYKSRSRESPMIGRIMPDVVVTLEECAAEWCEVEAGKIHGWIERKFIWGIYPQENFD